MCVFMTCVSVFREWMCVFVTCTSREKALCFEMCVVIHLHQRRVMCVCVCVCVCVCMCVDIRTAPYKQLHAVQHALLSHTLHTRNV